MKLAGLTLAKEEDPRKLGKRTAIIQSRFKVQVEEKEKILAVVNAGGFRYADAIGQEHRLCKMKSEPVTARKLIKAKHEKFRLKGGERERLVTWQLNVRTRKMVLVPEMAHLLAISVVG